MGNDTKPRVLFLCTGNSARSQMAEAFVRHYAGDALEPHSAGLDPRGVNPLAVRVMQEVGIDIARQESKSVKQYLGKMHFVHAITVCARVEEHCPHLFPMVEDIQYWPFEDPAVVTGSDEEKLAKFREVRDQIDVRVKAWIEELSAADGTDARRADDAATSIAFFSDVHGNAPALMAVLEDLRARAVDRVYCLGDLVGYGPFPNEVVDLVRAAALPTIAGNYDDGVAFERGECGCYYPDEEARRIGDASYAFTVAAVTEENKAWLRLLPRELRFEVGSVRFHLVHGSPRRINEYLLKDRDPRTYERLARTEEADVLVFGHTHVPWHRRYGGVLFVNVGSAGRPKDGDTRAGYTLVRVLADSAVEVTVVRVPYDVESTAAGALAVGLPPALAEAFRSGA